MSGPSVAVFAVCSSATLWLQHKQWEVMQESVFSAVCHELLHSEIRFKNMRLFQSWTEWCGPDLFQFQFCDPSLTICSLSVCLYTQLMVCSYVPWYLRVSYYLCMQREWKTTAGRSDLWSQNKALAQELPALGSHLPHKETLLADAFILLFMGGLGVKERDMCFHAMGRGWGCGEYLQVKT